MGQNDHLAHSKGPWKKHLYTGTIVTANGKKRYIYPGKGGGERVGATRVKANGERTHYSKNYQIDDNGKASKRPGTSAYAVKTKAKRKLQTTARDVKYYGGKALTKAGKAASEVAGNVKKKAKDAKYLTSAQVSVTKFKASQGAKRLAKKANKAVARGKVKAAGNAYVAKTMTKRAANNARRSVSAATSYGKSAINKLFTNAKGRARLVRANASAAAIKRKQAKRAKARKKA